MKKKNVSAVNIEMLISYWEIGRNIVEFEQKGKLKAEYGSQLLLKISLLVHEAATARVVCITGKR